MQFAEVALDCKNQGISVLDRLEALYAEFGYYTEKTIGLSLDPQTGAQSLKHALDGLRAAPPSEIGGLTLESVTDYMTAWTACPSPTSFHSQLSGRHTADSASFRDRTEGEDLHSL